VFLSRISSSECAAFSSRTSVYRIAAGGIAVERAEIALAVDQRHAHGEILAMRTSAS
jgi:hypothetical protein